MTTTEEPKVEEPKKEEPKVQSSDDEAEVGEEGQMPGKSNRGEKKFKKAMNKMGLKPVQGINRVTLKKGKNFLISIDDPDVWKSPGSESAYIVFGKPNMDGMQGQNEIDRFKSPTSLDQPSEQKPDAPTQKTEKAEETGESEPISEEGLSPDNIQMVMEYAKCSKAEAIKVLKETNDDTVNAIMKLTG